MSETYNPAIARDVLAFIEYGQYNVDRPDHIIIKELIHTIFYLDQKIKCLEEEN